MSKTKSTYFCQNCGAQSAKWIGKCPSCNEWNTYVEEIINKKEEEKFTWRDRKNQQNYTPIPQKLEEIADNENERNSTEDIELDRVLGGGLVKGSLILLGGEPGIGKSTLLLQVALQVKNQRVLYVSGEESGSQIKLRAERIKQSNTDFYIITETNTQKIFQHTKELKPQLVIIDSIQTIFTDSIESTPGSVSQIRECAAEMQRYAKENGVSVLLVGHITKDGSIAGPKVLEHIVDVVLQFEGDHNYLYRILRTLKNRFGSTNEIGLYEMNSNGLKIVDNPSQLLLTDRSDEMSGISIASTMEGLRPMMAEIQALVSNAVYGTAQRSATGFDVRRLHMLLAVLEKRAGYKIAMKDVFLNIAGGFKLIDPAMDLAVIASIMSSYEDQAIPYKYAFAGEVGLSGEVRSVTRVEQRIAEAQKLGFEKIFISSYALKGIQQKYTIQIVPVSKVYELLKLLF
ncbi:MAG: DNA repair protein RadA [Bacteroidota bacterium]